MKLSFTAIRIQAFQLLDTAVFASSSEDFALYYDSFISYLNHSGYSESEFDSELIKYIDNNWIKNVSN